jgi:lipase
MIFRRRPVRGGDPQVRAGGSGWSRHCDRAGAYGSIRQMGPVHTDVSYRQYGVPVRGGELWVGAWGGSGPLVLLVHGITSSHKAFALIGPQLGRDHRVVAVDLRGRGRSRDLPAPYGMAAHAEDMVAVIESCGGGAATLVGHSMGGFVTVATVRARPDLVARAVLVDGGPPLAPPPGLDVTADEESIAEAVTAAVGQAYARLSMTFPDRDAYRALWRAHPALREWNDAMESYVDYDLVGAAPRLQAACRLEAALRDARDLYAFAGVEPAALPVPSVFLRAERGMFDETTPFYPPGYASTWLPGIDERAVAGVNHYTITLGPAGAAEVVAAVRAAA